MIVLDNINMIVDLIVKITPPILTFIGLLLTKYWIPQLKAREKLDTAEERKLALIEAKAWVEIAVRSAEQLFKNIPKSGVQKKEHAIRYLKEKGVNLNMEDLNALIESAVKELDLLEKKFVE